MKASIKFRDDQKPLLRAKVPISILGLPFVSGVSTGDPKELRLDLSTSFESGPSFRVSYKPNDPSAPFSLLLKTGIGSFGSPSNTPFAMSAQFNLINRNNGCSGPAFFILFKPRFGDFVLKKSVKSNSVETMVKNIDNEINGQDCTTNGLGGFRPFDNGFTSTKGGIERFLSGTEFNAKSVLPIFNRANLKFRWGLRVPAELNPNISISKMPLLVMNKLSIEHVMGNFSKEGDKNEKNKRGDEVASGCVGVKPEIDALRRVVEDLRADVSGWKFNPVADVSRGGGAQNAVGGKSYKRNNHNGKVLEGSGGLEEVKLPGVKFPELK